MINLIILQLLLVSLISCEKEVNSDNFPVTLKFELLDSIGNSTTQFNYGEKIIFSFKMENNSDSKLYYKIDFINDDFFKVYKKDGETLNQIGKPYHSINYLLRLGQHIIPAGETYGFILPWISDSGVNYYPPFFYVLPNEPLEKGEYYTGFSSGFKFHTKNHERTYESKNKTFQINFIVQ